MSAVQVASRLEGVRRSLDRSAKHGAGCDSSTTTSLYHLRAAVEDLIDVVDELLDEREGGR